MSPSDALAAVPTLIEVGKSIFDAIKAASSGDGEEAHQKIREANARLTLELARHELK